MANGSREFVLNGDAGAGTDLDLLRSGAHAGSAFAWAEQATALMAGPVLPRAQATAQAPPRRGSQGQGYQGQGCQALAPSGAPGSTPSTGACTGPDSRWSKCAPLAGPTAPSGWS